MSIPSRLISAIEHVYRPAGMTVTVQPKKEPENAEYGGCTFKLDDRSVTFRIGKITPQRPGNFVALYDRVRGITVPVDTRYREIDFLVVDVSDQKAANRGQFVFPKATLLKRGIISNGLTEQDRLNRKKGKLSFRVFPPWANPKPTAVKTQKWQGSFFFPIPNEAKADFKLVRSLFEKV